MTEQESIKNQADLSTTGVVRRSLQATSFSLVGLFVIAAIATAYVLKPVLMPFVLALLCAAALHPIVARLERTGLPRTVIAALILGVFAMALSLTVWSFSAPVSDWVSRVPEQIERANKALITLRASMAEMAATVDELSEDKDLPYEPTVTIEKEKLSDTVLSWGMRAVGYFALTIPILYFVIGYGHLISEKLRVHWGYDLIGDIMASISSYLFNITMINAGLGLAIGLAMWLVGMPNPVLWGILAFVLNYLPYIGAITGISLVAFVAILTFESTTMRLIPPCAYFLLTSLEASFVTPTLLGLRFPLNPFVVIIWVIFWAWLWGVIGALFAVPLLMVVRLTCERFPRLEFVGTLIEKE